MFIGRKIKISMTKYYNKDDSIEGNDIQLVSRKFIFAGLYHISGIGRCIKYQCSRDSYAKITKCLLSTEKQIEKFSHIKIGDEVCSKDIIAYHKGIKPIKESKQSGFSGTHSTGVINTKSRSIAKITHPFENIQNSINKYQQQIESKNGSLLKK